jgi:DNA-binding FadR family transcriptional regulator
MAERLARQIVDEIAVKGLKPGSLLPGESEMLRSYGVGRATLREALLLLEVLGLISVKPGPGGGPSVVGLTSRDFGDMAKLHFQVAGATYGDVLDARAAIEAVMARLAATTQDAAGLSELRAVAAEAEATELEDDVAFQALSRSFHVVLGSISGNPVLNLFGRALKDVYDQQVRAGMMPVDERGRVRAAHAEITTAILEGRAEDAERLTRDHALHYGDFHRRHHPGLLDQRVAWD